MKRLEAAATLPAVEMERLGAFQSGSRTYRMVLMHLGEPGAGKLGAMIAGGIHGDEPAGVEAAVRFIEVNAGNAELLSRFFFVVFPCNNPSGYELNTRENADGIDLNRQFAIPNPAPEVELITRGLAGRCFDLVFEMHEDIDAPGLYLYEISDDPTRYFGEKIIAAAESMGYPIHPGAVIERMRAKHGVIRRGSSIKFRKTRLPQAIYTYRTCGGHVITLEPPVQMLSHEDRVKIALMALDIALSSLS